MAYGKVKADALIYNTGGNDVEVTISEIMTSSGSLSNYALLAGATFTGDVNFDAGVIVKGDSTNGSGELTLNCENNSHGVKIKGPPHSAGASYTLILPNNTGTSGQVLTTNGSGVSSWSSVLPLTGGTLTGDLTIPDKIIHSGDTDTYIRFPAANTFAIETAGTQRVTVDSSGRVLVGTTTEGEGNADDLTIASTGNTGITVRSGTSSSGNIFFSDGTSGNDEIRGYIQYLHASNSLLFGTNAQERLRIDSSGKVGINQSSPTAFIHAKSGANDGTVIGTFEGATNNKLDIKFNSSGPALNVTAGDPLAFEIGGTERMRIDSSGRVGIGTSSPYSVLGGPAVNIHNSGGSAELNFLGSTTGYNGIYFGDATSGSARNRGYIEYYHAQDYMRFATAELERMRIDSSGNVGIGTSPDSKLHVKDSSNNGLRIGYTGNTNYYDAPIHIWRHPNFFTERMRIDSDGRLLLGRSTTSAGIGHNISYSATGLGALTVINTNSGAANSVASFSTATNLSNTTNSLIKFFVNGFGAGSGAIVVNGTSQAAFATYSDRRLKKNIVELPSQLENIKNLRPVEFDYIEGGHQIGFIAQEFQDVYPDAVALAPSEKNPEEERLTITGWSKTEAYLVKALQEAIGEIETLKQRLSDAGIAQKYLILNYSLYLLEQSQQGIMHSIDYGLRKN